MTLRDRLLAHLREANYSPANEFELSRRLGLTKKERHVFAHEVRLALKSGEFVRAVNGRIAPRGTEQTSARAPFAARPIFTPTRRGPTMPPASAPSPFSAMPGGDQRPEVRPGAAGRHKSPRTRHETAEAQSESARGKSKSERNVSRKKGRGELPPTTGSTKPPGAGQKDFPPLAPGELAGRIQFRGGGSAFVVLEPSIGGSKSGEPPIQIFAEDTGVALPGDRVVVRAFPGRRGRKPGEKIGGVVRVLERDRDTIVGNLVRGRREFVVQPDDPRFSYEILVGDPANSGISPPPTAGDKVVVKLDEWNNRRDSLTGNLISRLGRTH